VPIDLPTRFLDGYSGTQLVFLPLDWIPALYAFEDTSTFPLASIHETSDVPS